MAGEILRDIGSIPIADIQAGIIDWSYFVRVDVPAPVGITRWTDRAASFTGNVDGAGAQTWTAGNGLQIGDVQQGRELILNPTWFSLANLNYTWTNWANSPGLSNAAALIYVGWFGAAGALTGGVKLYEGVIGYHRMLSRAEISLNPGTAKSRRRCVAHIPGRSPLIPAPLMPDDGVKIYRTSTSR